MLFDPAKESGLFITDKAHRHCISQSVHRCSALQESQRSIEGAGSHFSVDPVFGYPPVCVSGFKACVCVGYFRRKDGPKATRAIESDATLPFVFPHSPALTTTAANATISFCGNRNSMQPSLLICLVDKDRFTPANVSTDDLLSVMSVRELLL